jgi:ribose transport system ATP-binding protein
MNCTADGLLRATGIDKAFPGVQALSRVDFDLRAGEVHALVGENGAGKSTLTRILAGVQAPDGGKMSLAGRPYVPASRLEAEGRGVRMVMQELNLIGNLTVAENIFIERLPSRFGFIDYPKLHQAAREAMEKVGLGDTDPATPVRTLGVGRQQMVEIAAGLSRRCRVLALDEPTASLTGGEVELLFTQIRRLQAEGVGVIYISHRIEEVLDIADRVTVLRDGKVVGTCATKEVDPDTVIRMMVGRDLGHECLAPSGARGELALRVSGLCRGDRVRDVSFEAYRGEILGVAGLMGSGRTETMRAIFGADPPEAGAVYLHGTREPARIRKPRDAVRRGIALLTEDRKEQGLFLSLPVRANVSITRLGGPRRYGRSTCPAADAQLSRARTLGGSLKRLVRSGVVRRYLHALTSTPQTGVQPSPRPSALRLPPGERQSLTHPLSCLGWINLAREQQVAEHYVDALGVKCWSVEQAAGQLSGGNQQKVVIAKWLFRDCDILIFDEPTRGIDVGAKFEIYRMLGDLAGQGKAILFVSSDLKELMAVCNRILVLSAGRVAGTFARDQWTEEAIMAAAFREYVKTPGGAQAHGR